MNEEQLMAKFHNMYSNDQDVPHSCQFVENPWSCCYHDEKLVQLKKQINMDELKSDIEEGSSSFLEKTSKDELDQNGVAQNLKMK